jgi:type VI secretion system protein ImpK
MTTATLDAPPSVPTAAPVSRGGLALALQEALTVAIRVRGKRQTAADANAFRTHVKQLLAAADAEARRAGYDPEHVRLAIYAYTAFLDESVLNSNQPMFAAWPRQSLQEEVFGDHVAGENFYVHLQELMSRQDSEQLADLLEVFQLCLLLGFRGRYAVAAPGAIEAVTTPLQQKIARIRGPGVDLSPAWPLPAGESMAAARDPWLRKLGIVSVASAIFAALLYVTFRISLAGGVADLQTLTSQLVR